MTMRKKITGKKDYRKYNVVISGIQLNMANISNRRVLELQEFVFVLLYLQFVM